MMTTENPMTHNERKESYQRIVKELSSLCDTEITALLANSPAINNSIGGSSTVMKIDDTPIFIKKIRLTNLEQLPENIESTANLFNLPLYYQYGVGSTGFGAWRELAAHRLATKWVLDGACANFPCLYHWRILPKACQIPDHEQLIELDKDVRYWNNSAAIRERLVANLSASAEIVLFLEYFPNNLYQWFGQAIAQGDASARKACDMVETQLHQTISFMKSQGFIHFDAHFHNILTDGERLYFSDFGLAIFSGFKLSALEKSFFNYHIDYDSYSTVTNFLHCFVTHYSNSDQWIESLQDLMSKKQGELPPYFAAMIKRYTQTALLMDEFYRNLQQDKATNYPAKKLAQALKNYS